MLIASVDIIFQVSDVNHKLIISLFLYDLLGCICFLSKIRCGHVYNLGPGWRCETGLSPPVKYFY